MKTVLLSFDLEEFEMPQEYGKIIPFEEQIAISARGTEIILDILHEHHVPATFFCTAVFASHATDLISRLTQEGHEIASHGYTHSTFKNEHLLESRIELKKISGQSVVGFRMPRMMPVENDAIQRAGYTYDSSLNPVYLPGRYNNIMKPRTWFRTHSLIHVPASAIPLFRFPLFWLSFHHLPLWLYKAACRYTIHYDRYLNIYFHPWEFIELTPIAYGLPKFLSKNSGAKMIGRFQSWIRWMKGQEYAFTTIAQFVASRQPDSQKDAFG